MLADQGCICGETDRCGFGSLDEDKIALNEFCECRGGTRTALLFLVLC